MIRFSLPLLLIVCLAHSTSTAQTPALADSALMSEAMESYEERRYVTFLVDPFSVYSLTYGFGFRAHVTAHNVLWPDNRLRLIAKPYQRRGTYALTLQTHDPADHPVYGLTRVRFELNGGSRFYGLGAGTDDGNRLQVSYSEFEVFGKLGFRFADRRLHVQPVAVYQRLAADDFEESDEEAFSRLTPSSQLALLYAVDAPPDLVTRSADLHAGYRLGVKAAVDLRDTPSYPTRGVRLSGGWFRYTATSSLDVTFDRFEGAVHGFIPLGVGHVIAVRAALETTTNQGDDPIPFFLLPRLDYTHLGGYKENRFIGRDMAVLNAEYRWQAVNLADLYRVSVFVQAGLGNVYDDVFDQFTLEPTLETKLESNDYRLRPGFGIGMRVSATERERDLIHWMLGVSPEGFTLASFTFVHEFGRIE